MHPILFKIPLFGGLTIYTYGFFVALAYLVGIIWISRESKIRGLSPSKAMDLTFYVILAAILGGRVFHVLISEWDRFLNDPIVLFKVWQGGLVFYGGLIFGIITTIVYMRAKKMEFWRYVDVFAPAVSIGHAIGRIGCLMAGCCYGRVVEHNTWFSIIFPQDPHSFAPTGVPLYPTQLMEVLGELIIFSLLLVIGNKKKFDGQLMAIYLIAYAILRGFVEYFRGDYVRGFIIEPWISTSQFISIILFVIGVIIYIKRSRKIS